MESDVFKALSDPNRLKIFEMLSEGELCACKILETLNITQPTLSHHMAILQKSKLINVRKERQWSYYSINEKTVKEINNFLIALISNIPQINDGRNCHA